MSGLWPVLRKILLLLLVIAGTALISKPEFRVRDLNACQEAIGPLSGLPAAADRFLSPGSDFELLGKPRAGDWLSQFPEKGQTFAAYEKAGFNRFVAPRNKLYLQPLGDFSSAPFSLVQLRDFTSRFFAAEVIVLEAVDLASCAFRTRVNPHTQNRQLRTGDVLEWLKKRLPADAYCLTAVTMFDLYPDDNWNFVFGEATLEERVGVFSFCRYDPVFYGKARGADYQSLMLRRSCKVLAHEIGHMYGLYHCVFFKCLMNGSNHLAESDSRPMHECPVCLRKFWSNIGFDIAARYRGLLEFYKSVGFTDEASWIENRLQNVEKPSSSR